jgi:hypothetical protein
VATSGTVRVRVSRCGLILRIAPEPGSGASHEWYHPGRRQASLRAGGQDPRYEDKYIDKTGWRPAVRHPEQRHRRVGALGPGAGVRVARLHPGELGPQAGQGHDGPVRGQRRQDRREEFNDAVGIVKRATQGKRNDVQVKRMVLQIMQEEAHQPRTGMFSNWHARVKKEVGMA